MNLVIKPKIREQQIVIAKFLEAEGAGYRFHIFLNQPVNKGHEAFLYLRKGTTTTFRKEQYYPLIVKSIVQDCIILSDELSPAEKTLQIRAWKRSLRAHEIFEILQKKYKLGAAVLHRLLNYHKNEDLYEAFEKVLISKQFVGDDLTDEAQIEILELLAQKIHLPQRTITRSFHLILYEENGVEILNRLFEDLRASEGEHMTILYQGSANYQIRYEILSEQFKEAKGMFHHVFKKIQESLGSLRFKFIEHK